MCWQVEYLNQSIVEGREGCGIHKWPKKPKLAHITDYLPADLSADAHPRINISKNDRGKILTKIKQSIIRFQLIDIIINRLVINPYFGSVTISQFVKIFHKW